MVIANNEPTAEEKEAARAENVKNTLEYELLRKAIGGNEVKAHPFFYGQLGVQGGKTKYLEAMLSPEADKERKRIYAGRVAEQNQLGIAEEPSFATNYDVMKDLKQQLKEVQAIARLGELEEHAKSVGAKLNFEVPDELKNYSEVEIIQKAYNPETKEVDEDKLSESEKDALGMHEVLIKGYERALAIDAAQSNYFSDINSAGTQIADKYKNEEKEAA